MPQVGWTQGPVRFLLHSALPLVSLTQVKVWEGPHSPQQQADPYGHFRLGEGQDWPWLGSVTGQPGLVLSIMCLITGNAHLSQSHIGALGNRTESCPVQSQSQSSTRQLQAIAFPGSWTRGSYRSYGDQQRHCQFQGQSPTQGRACRLLPHWLFPHTPLHQDTLPDNHHLPNKSQF